ncbi:MAG: hypothetical protein Q9160_008924 [Pyrenula sp. 1 TL-2023]
MRFGQTLQSSIYPLWKEQYVDYGKLKSLLREGETFIDSGQNWTDKDEEQFSHELLNVELPKVEAFQTATYQRLRDRTTACESKLNPLADAKNQGDSPTSDRQITVASDVQKELNNITLELTELERYNRINFTGFLKAVKKHDRRRGQRYRLKPMLQVQLNKGGLNSEEHAPQSLMYRLSAMYEFVRSLNTDRSTSEATNEILEARHDAYSSFKFFVHADHVLEVKMTILRHLPVLIYNPSTDKVVDYSQKDPTITSIYFDNPNFDLYTHKVNRAGEAGALRLRWTGKLSEQPQIFLEKKTVINNGGSRDVRIPMKEKYIEPFIKGGSRLEKPLQKLEKRSGPDSDAVQTMRNNTDEVRAFIIDQKLEPMLRANYTRTAFQIPGDDRVRVSLDTNLALIREDSLDSERPCRDPDQWHRAEVDDNKLEFPYSSIKKGEINRFPYAILEVKIKEGKRHSWLEDLMASHLVKEVPRFSKFVSGVALLFEDYVNSFPFWLNDLENDIRRDPEIAFEEEQQKQAKRAEDEFAVGSFKPGSRISASPTTKPRIGSPGRFADSPLDVLSKSPSGRVQKLRQSSLVPTASVNPIDREDVAASEVRVTGSSKPSGLMSFLPIFSNSRYGRRHRQKQGKIALPPGVEEPGVWLKDTGVVKVEPKVWLANQRTFVMWQRIVILLATLGLGFYNAAGLNNTIAQILAIVYIGFAMFSAAWGYGVYMRRSELIRKRDGRDLDYVVGPVIVSFGLFIALCINFGVKYVAVSRSVRDIDMKNTTAMQEAEV